MCGDTRCTDITGLYCNNSKCHHDVSVNISDVSVNIPMNVPPYWSVSKYRRMFMWTRNLHISTEHTANYSFQDFGCSPIKIVTPPHRDKIAHGSPDNMQCYSGTKMLPIHKRVTKKCVICLVQVLPTYHACVSMRFAM